MAKNCGPSEGLTKLTGGIDNAKAELDSLIGTGVNGLADSAVALKDKIAGLTDGIGADLDTMAPEIPQPKFKLQDQMTSLLDNADNPGALIAQMDEIREQFGSTVDVDKMFEDFGLDSKELSSMNKEYKDKIKEGEELKILSQQGKVKLDGKTQELIALATGDVSAIGNLIGAAADKIFGGKDIAALKDQVCSNIPNVEMDVDGNIITKGTESKAATEDADAEVETAERKSDLLPKVKDQGVELANLIIAPAEEIDAEPFTFGPPISLEEIQKEGVNSDEYIEDSDTLRSYQLILREDRDEYNKARQNKVGEPGIPVDLDREYYHNALNKTISLLSTHIAIKYNTADNPNTKPNVDIRGTDYEIPESKIKIPFDLSGDIFDQVFDNPPKNSSNRHKPLGDFVKQLEFINVLESQRGEVFAPSGV